MVFYKRLLRRFQKDHRLDANKEFPYPTPNSKMVHFL